MLVSQYNNDGLGQIIMQDREQILQERERQWDEDNLTENRRCELLMRSYMPDNIGRITPEEFRELVLQKELFYPDSLIQRLRQTRLLHWVVMPEEDRQLGETGTLPSSHEYSASVAYSPPFVDLLCSKL